MWINVDAFTPYHSLIGGLLIGLAAFILIFFCGRVMGISGILGGLLHKGSDLGWRLFFIAGLLISPWLYQFITFSRPEIQLTASWPTVIIAGLLVGFGTRLGSGCTSGHGVCGLSRLSLRSLVATLIFMFVAIMTVYIVSLLK